MKRPAMIFVLWLLVAPMVFGQEPPAARVDEVFAKWNKPTSPGCAMSVMKEGRIIDKRAYGMANLDYDIPLTTASVFHVASVSKQFTAAAVVLLALQKKLSLDDPVRKYAPELPDFGEPITIRHLIHHTSGLRDQWALLGLAGSRYSLDRIGNDDVLELVSRQKALNFRPGEKYLYSNTGYTLLAVIASRVSGKSFRDFTDENIFRPLGMKNTHFRDDFSEVVKNQAYGYLPARGNAFRTGATNFDTVGATSLLTTVEDIALWDRNFFEPKVGGAPFIEQMHERGRQNNGEAINYAFALIHGAYRGLAVVEHSGSDAGFRAHFLRFPQQRYSFAVFCNAGPVDARELARKLADIYLEKELKDRPVGAQGVQLSSEQLKKREGLYLDAESGGSMRIAIRDGGLAIQSPGQALELKALSEKRFEVVGRNSTAEFEEAAGTEASRLIISDEAGGKSTYDFMPPYAMPADLKAGYTGEYVSEEIEPVFRIAIEGENLVLKRFKYRAAALNPVARDLFLTDSGTIRFTRDGEGRVSGFVYNLGRIRNFHLKKRPVE